MKEEYPLMSAPFSDIPFEKFSKKQTEIHFAIFHPKYYFNAFADSNYNYRRIFYRKLCG